MTDARGVQFILAAILLLASTVFCCPCRVPATTAADDGVASARSACNGQACAGESCGGAGTGASRAAAPARPQSCDCCFFETDPLLAAPSGVDSSTSLAAAGRTFTDLAAPAAQGAPRAPTDRPPVPPPRQSLLAQACLLLV